MQNLNPSSSIGCDLHVITVVADYGEQLGLLSLDQILSDRQNYA